MRSPNPHHRLGTFATLLLMLGSLALLVVIVVVVGIVRILDSIDGFEFGSSGTTIPPPSIVECRDLRSVRKAAAGVGHAVLAEPRTPGADRRQIIASLQRFDIALSTVIRSRHLPREFEAALHESRHDTRRAIAALPNVDPREYRSFGGIPAAHRVGPPISATDGYFGIANASAMLARGCGFDLAPPFNELVDCTDWPPPKTRPGSVPNQRFQANEVRVLAQGFTCPKSSTSTS